VQLVLQVLIRHHVVGAQDHQVLGPVLPGHGIDGALVLGGIGRVAHRRPAQGRAIEVDQRRREAALGIGDGQGLHALFNRLDAGGAVLGHQGSPIGNQDLLRQRPLDWLGRHGPPGAVGGAPNPRLDYGR
jgi:hypothetical protein